MKVTLRDIVESSNALSSVINTKMEASKAFKFRKLVKFLDSNVSVFEEVKQKIIEENNLRDEEGNINIPDDIRSQIDGEFEDLLNQEIDFELEFNIDDFDGIEITPLELDKLMWIIQ